MAKYIISSSSYQIHDRTYRIHGAYTSIACLVHTQSRHNNQTTRCTFSIDLFSRMWSILFSFLHFNIFVTALTIVIKWIFNQIINNEQKYKFSSHQSCERTRIGRASDLQWACPYLKWITGSSSSLIHSESFNKARSSWTTGFLDSGILKFSIWMLVIYYQRIKSTNKNV